MELIDRPDRRLIATIVALSHVAALLWQPRPDGARPAAHVHAPPHAHRPFLHLQVTQQELEREVLKFGPASSVWVARNPAGFAFVVRPLATTRADSTHHRPRRRVSLAASPPRRCLATASPPLPRRPSPPSTPDARRPAAMPVAVVTLAFIFASTRAGVTPLAGVRQR